MHPAGSPYASPHNTPHKLRNPLPRVDDADDDKQSTMSHASGVPRAEHALESLRLVAGNRVRRARCAPEFLEEIVNKGVQDSLKDSSSRRFKIIIGSDARSYFKNYVQDYNKELEQSRNDNDKNPNEIIPSPIVFAVTAWDAGQKCIDYYMTWRAKAKGRHSKEYERQVAVLDEEFRRLARGLDKEYKRISPLRTFGNLSQPNRKFEKAHHSSHKPRAPPGIAISSSEEPLPVSGVTQTPLPEPPVSASDSVMSLPLLNMIRGVPLSHRIPLRIANPDRLSMISDIDVVPCEEVNSAMASKVTKPEPPSPEPVGSLSVENPVHDSSASIFSAHTTSSESSKSSRSSSPSEIRDKGDREDSRSKNHEIPEYLIVLLGDKLDTDANSWHGLDRQVSIRSLPADRHSPWIGVVAHSENTNNRNSPSRTPSGSDDEGSEDESGWIRSPAVIPLKPLMEVMGLMPKPTHHSPRVVPGGLQYQLSVANAMSPAPSQSPYLYGSPRLDSSPYVPAWASPLHFSPNAPSRPVSRAYSSASYASPYMQTHTGPF